MRRGWLTTRISTIGSRRSNGAPTRSKAAAGDSRGRPDLPDYNSIVSRAAEDDAVIAAYKQSIDRTLLRENLGRTPDERLRQLQELQRFADELRRAGAELRLRKP